jgi:hypothetical protein
MGLQEELAALYETDFHEWTQRNGELLSHGRVPEADIPHIVEEIRDMGERDKRGVRSRLVGLITHLLNWQFQPQLRYTESGHASGIATIDEQQLTGIFEQSGNLERHGRSDMVNIYRRAVKETGISQTGFPSDYPYSFQIMHEEFLPGE